MATASSIQSQPSPRRRGATSGPRLETRFDRRLARILVHATNVFCDKGYAAASMRDLSRASGVSLSGLYYYFESKEELLYLIQKHTFTTIVDRLRPRLEEVADPAERIRVFILNHLEYFLANQKAMKVLSHEDDVLKNGFGAEIAAIKREYYRICMELLDNYKAARGLEFSSRTAVLSLFGMMNWIYTWYNPRVDADAAELAREMGDIFLQGIGRPPPKERRGRSRQYRAESDILTIAKRSTTMATTVQPASGETTKQLINYRVDAGVAVIELCDPPANTYTYEMNRQLDEAILKARMDNDVYVIVLTGAGDKFFSAGANIKMLVSVDPTFKYYFCLHANETLLRLEHTPKLVIAALNGHCVGGGLEIAMAADIRIARQDAGKIGLPEVNLGVLPGTGGTQRLSRIVGKSKAIELMVTGNTFSFEEAKELGIVNDIYERDNFMENIMEYARQFCPPNKAAKAVGRIKRAVQTGWEIPMESALAVERENQQLLFQSEDAKEGLAAYVEKRPAVFKAK